MKKQYTAIDILKLFFSICVVGIHTGIMQNESSNIEWGILHAIFRLAVPFFFVCSGFFLGIKIYNVNSIEEGINIIKKYIYRLIIPLIFWLIVGLPMKVYGYRQHNLIMIIIRVVRDIIFYPWGALWYVWGVIISAIIIIPFYKRNKTKVAILIGGILYCFALLCNNYYFLIEGTVFQRIVDLYLKICVSARNGIFEGLYFVSVGIYIGKLVKEGNVLNIKKHNITLICTYIIFLFEVFLIKGNIYKDDHSLYIMFLILIPELLIAASNINFELDTKILRNYSTGIYFMHRPIINLVNTIFILSNLSISNNLMFIIVILVAIVLLTILYRIDNKYLNKVIK